MENIKYYWRKLRSFWWNIQGGIESVRYYLPIIWKSRDWDYSYVNELQLHAFKRLRKGISSRNAHIVPKGFHQRMRDIEILMERLNKDEYFMMEGGANPAYPGAPDHDFNAGYMQEQDMKYLHRLIQKGWYKYWD